MLGGGIPGRRARAVSITLVATCPGGTGCEGSSEKIHYGGQAHAGSILGAACPSLACPEAAHHAISTAWALPAPLWHGRAKRFPKGKARLLRETLNESPRLPHGPFDT